MGDLEDKLVVGGVFALIVVMILAVFGLFVLALGSKWEWSEDNVSGIVYSTTNNSFISGNTNFKVRASVDTYIYHDSNGNTNESAYCLPPNSPYKELVNKAAADKNIKVQVQTKKGFWVKLPWTCIDNVVVTEIK